MSSLVITVKMEESQAVLQQKYQLSANNTRPEMQELKKLFRDFASGAKRASVYVQTGSSDPVAAAGSIVLASFANNDTVTIGGVTLTGKSSPTTEDHFEIDGNDAADAAALRACINAHSVLSKVIVAGGSSDTVSVTALQKGLVGNQIIMSQTGDHATLTQMTGGTGGAAEAAVTYSLGI